MNGQPNYTKLGIFVLSGIALIVTIFLILSAGVLFRSQIMLETYFEGSVHGLSAGSDVVYRGVKVGAVEEISFTAVHYQLSKPLDDRKPYVLVRFAVYPAFFGGLSRSQVRDLISSWVKRGLCVQLEPQGLTGLSYMEMDFVQHPGKELSFDWKPQHPYIPSTPNVLGTIADTIKSVQATLKQVQQVDVAKLGKDLDNLVTTAQRSVDEAQVGSLASEAHSLLADIRRNSDQLSALLSNPILVSTLHNASGAARAGREMAEAGQKDLPQILDNVRKASDALVKGSADLPSTVEDLNRALRSLASLLDQQQQTISETLQNLRAASRSVRELTEKANQYPAGTLFGTPPAPVHPGEKE